MTVYIYTPVNLRFVLHEIVTSKNKHILLLKGVLIFGTIRNTVCLIHAVNTFFKLHQTAALLFISIKNHNTVDRTTTHDTV